MRLTMRTLYLILSISLLSLLFTGICAAGMMSDSCHGQETAAKPMKMGSCCCSLGLAISAADDESSGRIPGAGCCTTETCRKTFVPERAALGFASSVDYSFSADPIATFPSATPVYPAIGCMELPPPRAPASPVYLKNCSFLI